MFENIIQCFTTLSQTFFPENGARAWDFFEKGEFCRKEQEKFFLESKKNPKIGERIISFFENMWYNVIC